MSSTILTDIVRDYESISGTWFAALFPIAQAVFWVLVLIELVWAAIWWAVDREDGLGVLSALLRKVLALDQVLHGTLSQLRGECRRQALRALPDHGGRREHRGAVGPDHRARRVQPDSVLLRHGRRPGLSVPDLAHPVGGGLHDGGRRE